LLLKLAIVLLPFGENVNAWSQKPGCPGKKEYHLTQRPMLTCSAIAEEVSCRSWRRS
jgi:hypothetical protein